MSNPAKNTPTPVMGVPVGLVTVPSLAAPHTPPSEGPSTSGQPPSTIPLNHQVLHQKEWMAVKTLDVEKICHSLKRDVLKFFLKDNGLKAPTSFTKPMLAQRAVDHIKSLNLTEEQLNHKENSWTCPCVLDQKELDGWLEELPEGYKKIVLDMKDKPACEVSQLLVSYGGKSNSDCKKDLMFILINMLLQQCSMMPPSAHTASKSAKSSTKKTLPGTTTTAAMKFHPPSSTVTSATATTSAGKSLASKSSGKVPLVSSGILHPNTSASVTPLTTLPLKKTTVTMGQIYLSGASTSKSAGLAKPLVHPGPGTSTLQTASNTPAMSYLDTMNNLQSNFYSLMSTSATSSGPGMLAMASAVPRFMNPTVASSSKAAEGGAKRTSLTPMLPQGNECCVCLQRKRQIGFIPCGHVACCKPCSDSQTLCPLCRKTITAKQVLYFS